MVAESRLQGAVKQEAASAEPLCEQASREPTERLVRVRRRVEQMVREGWRDAPSRNANYEAWSDRIDGPAFRIFRRLKRLQAELEERAALDQRQAELEAQEAADQHQADPEEHKALEPHQAESGHQKGEPAGAPSAGEGKATPLPPSLTVADCPDGAVELRFELRRRGRTLQRMARLEGWEWKLLRASFSGSSRSRLRPR